VLRFVINYVAKIHPFALFNDAKTSSIAGAENLFSASVAIAFRNGN
jgi:hypothetical protein